MRIRLGKWYPFSLLALLTLTLTIFGLACVCTGGRQNTPTPTRVSVAVPATATLTARPSATATKAPPSPTPTKQVLLPTKTVTIPATATATLPETVELINPSPKEMDAAFRDMPTGASFTLALSEDYVNTLALEYLDNATDLPINISDIVVDFVPDRVEASAILPLGFFRVEVVATGYWRAVNCKFEAEILDVLIAGQAAPASLREQIDPMLKQALEASANAPVCFTQVEISDDLLVINGYKE